MSRFYSAEGVGKLQPWDHSLSTLAKFTEKLAFLTSDTHTYACVSEGKKMSVFRKTVPY